MSKVVATFQSRDGGRKTEFFNPDMEVGRYDLDNVQEDGQDSQNLAGAPEYLGAKRVGAIIKSAPEFKVLRDMKDAAVITDKKMDFQKVYASLKRLNRDYILESTMFVKVFEYLVYEHSIKFDAMRVCGYMRLVTENNVTANEMVNAGLIIAPYADKLEFRSLGGDAEIWGLFAKEIHIGPNFTGKIHAGQDTIIYQSKPIIPQDKKLKYVVKQYSLKKITNLIKTTKQLKCR